MTEGPRYTPYHPRWHRTPVSTWWWTRKRAYFLFIVRELTSLAVAWTAAILILLVRALGRGPEAWARFQERLESPVLLALNALAFLMLLYHALTWFHLAPKAMAVVVGGRRVPAVLIAGANYAAWLGVSAFLVLTALGG